MTTMDLSQECKVCLGLKKNQCDSSHSLKGRNHIIDSKEEENP